MEERVGGDNGAPGSVSPSALSGVQAGESIDSDQPAAWLPSSIHENQRPISDALFLIPDGTVAVLFLPFLFILFFLPQTWA